MRALAVVSVSWFLLVAAVAQDAAALEAREQKLVAKVVPALHALADALQGVRQHLRALELRREIWLEYAENDERARDKTGFVKVGEVWRKDDTRLVLDRDMKPETKDQKVLKKVDTDLAALTKELLAEHRALASGWQKAGDDGRAARHWQRVLRFAPGDKEAAAAMALQPFEGFRGTPDEIRILHRARTIRGACDWLRRTPFATTALTEQHPLLSAAKIEHTGVRSEHFTVWGTLAPADLQVLAEDCERALLLALTLHGTWTGALFAPVKHRDMVFLRDPAHYAAVLDACADQFDAARLQFLKADVDQAFVQWPTGDLRVHRAHLGLDASRDQAVRGVVQDATGIYAEGLVEGLGHAACGFLFGRTLTFLVEQLQAKTVSTWKPRALAPELSVWMQIAEESAWSKSDTRTSELVLLQAARFTAEQRVKAWAICHYLMHWRPDLLRELDRSQTKDIRSPPDVEAEFLRRTKVALPKVDADWREFWGRNVALRRAMTTDPVPEEKAPEHAARARARSLVDAVNAQRAAGRTGPAGFFVAVGPDAAAAQRFDEQLAKAEADRVKKPKEAIQLPTPPAVVGRSVLWSRHADAAGAVAQWWCAPPTRDALLHPGRELFGASPYAGAWLLDVAMPAQPTQRGLPQCWPRTRQPGVPATATLASIGARAAAAVAAARPGAEPVGTPLTLHFFRALEPKQLAQVACRVYFGANDVAGVLVTYGAADAGAEVADGCVAFVPLAPLPAGTELTVQWTLPEGFLAEEEVFPPVTFTAQ